MRPIMQRENKKQPIYVKPNLTREEWDAMTDEERAVFAKALAGQLVACVEGAPSRPPRRVSPFRYHRRRQSPRSAR